MTQAHATPELVERLRSPEWGEFRSVSSHVLCQEAAAALEAQQARIAELEAESAALTKALTGLTCGGSEFFIRKGDRYVADIDACVSWVRRAKEDAHRRTVKAITEQKASQALADRYEKALTEVRDLEPVPFEGGLDWAAIGACEDCQNYKDHPLMRGICNAHRRPLYDRESHDIREEKRLGWRAKCIAREALSSQGRREGGEDSSSRIQPCGVGPSDLTDPQSQHSDGGRDV